MGGPRSSGLRSFASRFGILAALLSTLPTPWLSAQTTFTVNTTSDGDDGACNVAHCSLREAINAANLEVGGATIAFDIPGPPPHTIRPNSSLPPLLGNILVDGTTEPDFAGTPVIELDGTNAGGFAQGLVLGGSGNTIRAMVVNRFSDVGISIGSGSTGAVVEGCYVGTNVTGSVALGNGNIGILIGQASNTTVGGTTAAARNVISGNQEGVTIVDATSTGNVILGNYIGTNASGTAAVPNFTGILLLAPDNTVGGTDPGAGNVISGNTGNGVGLGQPNGTGNVILGNYIGIDVTGATALGNDVGVFLNDVADNTIGGTAGGARNVISGNREGITLWEAGATGNLIQGNYIGTSATGDAAVPNGFGIPIYAPGNIVGGTEAGAGNLISGNLAMGVNFFGEDATGNTVQGNLIGTDAAGTTALGNGEQGVALVDAGGNTIGGAESGAGNVISGNVGSGVFLLGEPTRSNVIQGNFIGTDPTGTTAIGNGESGVAIHSANANLVGGTESGAGNILSGNTFGILVADFNAEGNIIQGNYVGTDAAGASAIPNTEMGILVWGENTIIGGSESGAGNVISGNGSDGIGLAEGSTGTVIQGNFIGTDASGTLALGNATGVFVNFSPDNNIGGTESGAGNVISGNLGNGVTLNGINATGNVVLGNLIGTDAAGTTKLANDIGILISDAPGNTFGGTEGGASNVISGNTRNGIRMLGPSATGNVFLGNFIGTDAAGVLDLGNGTAGIVMGGETSESSIGSAEANGGNVVAFNGRGGIVMTVNAGPNHLIRLNSVFENERLGIDLANDLVTENDESDADTGPNNLQNYPALTSVVSTGNAAIQASLNSTPSSSFTLDFFSDAACDESGFGEGRTPLGTASLSTDASGTGSVTAAFSGVTGTVVTATATDADGNTSEFSQCSEVTTLAVSSSPPTRTVAPGESAVYSISVTAQGGTFEETVGLSCSGNPAGTTCAFDQDQVTLASGSASATMTVTTVAPATFEPGAPGGFPPGPGAFWLTVFFIGIGLAAAGGGRVCLQWASATPLDARIRFGLKASLVAAVLLAATSCGDDGAKPPSGGTPAGSYEFTVTTTWESVLTSTTVTLVVQ